MAGEEVMDCHQDHVLQKLGVHLTASLNYPRTPECITVDHEGFGYVQTMPKKLAPLVGLNGYDARLYVNYRQEVTQAEQKRKEEDIINYEKDDSIDNRFWYQFQADYYFFVLLSRDEPIVEMQWIELEYMKAKRNPSLDLVIKLCEEKGIKGFIGFRYDWNEEIIPQFFATLYYQEHHNTVYWMTEGMIYSTDYMSFSRLLGFGTKDVEKDKVCHDRILRKNEI